MADIAISIAQKLIETIGSNIINEICDIWGYKSQLEELKETVFTIKMVLLDADTKQDLSNQERDYIGKLKEAVYDADDLFDEFLTLAELDQLGKLHKKGGKFIQKVRCFFSSKNQVGQAYRMSREVKELKNRLDVIASNHTKFKFDVDYKPIRKRREETCSYVDAKDIIGRDEDKEKIISMLLGQNNDHEGFCFLTIVGVGGLGKTALAQLVYNDERVIKEFSTLRMWVCVSDQDGERFDVKVILCKILESITHQKFDSSSSSMELVQKRFQEKLRGKKYFLVLDDVWNEDREKWVDLKKFLMLGQDESRIVVTTRSENTAKIIGDDHVYLLKGLSKENSWCLFEMSAFKRVQEDNENYIELVKIGKNIVEKCYNNPLAIKVVGSLLFGQDIGKWKSFKDCGLSKLGSGDKRIISILKLSYHNLEPSLKICFSYCSLFPKDVRIAKEMLISLWMAQGYIVSLDGEHSIEDAGEEYFSILLRRCFFQDVIKDEYGNVQSVKIHDLMHDVAQEVGKEEICVVTSRHREDQIIKYKNKIRHVHYFGVACQDSLCNSKLRSCLYWLPNRSLEGIQTNNLIRLRVLSLPNLGITSLPDSIGDLLLLRYLNLSSNMFLELPNSITKLYNLETLVLYGCSYLREFPKNMCKLVKLRYLDIKDCYRLTQMPLGMDKLINLKILPIFVVGKSSTHEQSEDELKALKVLTKIKGNILIEIGSDYRRNLGMEDVGYLNKMEHLTGATIRFAFDSKFDNPETLLRNMEPHSNLKAFRLVRYKGTTIPRWGRAEDNWGISLPHLVHLCLEDCRKLQHLPMLSTLPCLKSLELEWLSNLEYIENRSINNRGGDDKEASLFFPSLESLQMKNLINLKRWWKEEDDENQLRFRRLSKLDINYCPNLTSFPPCPSLKTLKNNNKKLQILVKIFNEEQQDDDDDDIVKLRDVILYNVGNLKSLPSSSVSSLDIDGDEEVKSLSQVGEDVIKSHASSLRCMTIRNCESLSRLSQVKGLELFTSLEDLILEENEQLSIEEENENDEPWKSFHQSLRHVTFRFLPKMTTLPKGMQYLTSLQVLLLDRCIRMEVLPNWISSLSALQSLNIENCPLKSLPEELRNVTSLKNLYIINCRKLEDRCKEPNGEDRPKIQHISNIIMGRGPSYSD